MKGQFASLLLLGSLLLVVHAERSTPQLKGRRGGYFNEPALARSNDANVAVAVEPSGDKEKLPAGAAVASKDPSKDASSGRLFLRKFLMFKNMFSSSNQPVIPIIITGGATGTAATTPTYTVTSTGTVPSATGTVTTTPTSSTSPTTATSPTTTATAGGRQYFNQQDDEQPENDDAEQDQDPEQDQAADVLPGAGAGAVAMAANAELLDEQALQAAIAAGAQEYEVFTEGDQADTGATESKATQNNRINLRRKGGRRGSGQMISVRIPPRYRRYFKNGQKVMLNTKSRPNRRRVVRRRVQNKNKNKRINNRRRGGKNKNKNKGKKGKKNKNKNKRPRLPVV